MQFWYVCVSDMEYKINIISSYIYIRLLCLIVDLEEVSDVGKAVENASSVNTTLQSTTTMGLSTDSTIIDPMDITVQSTVTMAKSAYFLNEGSTTFLI